MMDRPIYRLVAALEAKQGFWLYSFSSRLLLTSFIYLTFEQVSFSFFLFSFIFKLHSQKKKISLITGGDCEGIAANTKLKLPYVQQ